MCLWKIRVCRMDRFSLNSVKGTWIDRQILSNTYEACFHHRNLYKNLRMTSIRETRPSFRFWVKVSGIYFGFCFVRMIGFEIVILNIDDRSNKRSSPCPWSFFKLLSVSPCYCNAHYLKKQTKTNDYSKESHYTYA